MTHPDYGYYAKKAANTIFGEEGDFITAPEVSPLFSEVLAFWVVMQWERLKCPKVLNLVELGPGRGVLMQGVLATLDKLPSFQAECCVHFVEVNPELKELQVNKCRGFAEVKHYKDLEFLPTIKAPMILIANEFFDALPAQQYIKIGAEWRKNAVGIGRDNELDLVTLPTLSIPQSTEVQPDIPNVLKKVYSHIGQRGGAALIIDYGYWEGDDHTLQAVYKHKKVGILDQPGEVDLSVHVDFQSMAQQAESYHLTCNFQTQRQFLIDHGLQLRLQQLCEQLKDSDIIQALTAGVQRLIDPAQMGHLFKVLSICQ